MQRESQQAGTLHGLAGAGAWLECLFKASTGRSPWCPWCLSMVSCVTMGTAERFRRKPGVTAAFGELNGTRPPFMTLAALIEHAMHLASKCSPVFSVSFLSLQRADR